MKDGSIYNNIQKIFKELPNDFNILEEKIDLEVQMEYFKYSKKLKKERQNPENYLKYCDELFLPETTIDRQKKILIGLAGMENVKAYRTLEKFTNTAGSDIKEWAILALQESRMLIQTSLLDEQQYFISTGLGGKNKKLRYYIVFINNNRENILTSAQQKMVKDELIFGLKPEDGEFESIDFFEGFCSSLVLLPITADIKNIFSKIVEECNLYGNFLEEDMIITNVKILSRNEILDIINKQNKKNITDAKK